MATLITLIDALLVYSKKYRALCPIDRPNNAFYLIPLTKPSDTCWFSRVPLGCNKLSNAVASMCKLAGIQGFKTNHSLWATAATCLYSSGINEQLVMERTGHRSTEGIRSYKRTSTEQQVAVSDILNNVSKKPCTTSTDIALTKHPAITATPTSAMNTTIGSINLPIQLQTSNTDHAGAFYLSSCSNVNINFYCSK